MMRNHNDPRSSLAPVAEHRRLWRPSLAARTAVLVALAFASILLAPACFPELRQRAVRVDAAELDLRTVDSSEIGTADQAIRAVDSGQTSGAPPAGQTPAPDAELGPDTNGSLDAPAATTDGGPPASGAVLWERQIGAGPPRALAIDRVGSIIVAGTSFPEGGESDILLAKYSPEGEVVWRKTIGGPGQQQAQGLSVSAEDQLSVTGSFEGATDFGGQIKTASTGGNDKRDLFVAGYDASGTLRNVVSLGTPNFEEGSDVLVDLTSKDWIVTGFADNPIQLAGTILTGPLLMRMRPTGELRWARQGGGSSLAAQPNGTAIFAAGGSGVARLTPSTGMVEWSNDLGGLGVKHVSVQGGKVLVASAFADTLTVRGQQVRSRGEYDAFAAALDAATGMVLWSDVVAGSQVADNAASICGDETGNVYVVGTYGGSDQFVYGEPGQARHAFIAKYHQDGTREWIKVVGNSPSGESVLCSVPSGIVVGTYGRLLKLAR